MTHRSIETATRRTMATLTVLLLVAGCATTPGGSALPGSSGPSSTPVGSTGVPPASASARASATPVATPSSTSIAGTVTWNATKTSRTSPDSSEVWIVSGTMDLVLDKDLGQFVATRGRSSYAYDLEHVGCAPTTHETGTLETAIQTFPDDGVAHALIFGPTGADFEMQIFFDDSWVVTCPPGPALPETTIATAFPGCEASGKVTATFDGVGTYTIACEIAQSIDNGGIVVTGRIDGTLSPADQP